MADPDPAVADTDAATANLVERLQAAFAGDQSAITELLISHLLPAVLALLAVFVGYLVASYLARIVSAPICRRIDQTLGKFTGRVVFYGVLLAVVGVVLTQVGVKLGGLATILAAVGFAIGLAFQGTLSNFAAGVLLLVFRPFKVGDTIQAGGVMGKVDEIDLFTTTLDTPDHRRIIVPNSAISGSTIENISFHSHRRVEVLVGVAYQADIVETRQVLTAACVALQERTIPGEGRGFAVVLTDLGASSVNWAVRVWVAAPDLFSAREALTVEVKTRLDAAGISIPFPQLDVHLSRSPAERPPAVEPASASLPASAGVTPRLKPRPRGTEGQ